MRPLSEDEVAVSLAAAVAAYASDGTAAKLGQLGTGCTPFSTSLALAVTACSSLRFRSARPRTPHSSASSSG